MTAAVLALHYQNEVLHPDGRIRVGLGENDPQRDRVVEAAGRLLAGARGQGSPIVHVRIAFRPDYADCPRNTPIFRKTMELKAVQDGEWGSEFLKELSPLQRENEFVVTHTRISAFAGTSLENLLHMWGVQTVVVAGVATHSVVESSAREAADKGFRVIVAADACAAASPEVHVASLGRMALIAEVTDVDHALRILDEMDPDDNE